MSGFELPNRVGSIAPRIRVVSTQESTKNTLLAGDRALYLGTIRYRRNAFYEIIGMDVIDEYRQANAAFIRKFGNTLTLKKALLKPAR